MQTQLFNNDGNLLPQDGDVQYFPNFFSREESDVLIQELTNGVAWKQEPIKIFGREIMQPRLTAWYGDEGKAYSYSGITMQPLAWITALEVIKQRIEIAGNVQFNSALLNLYRDGKDSMGWHRDNEKELGPNPVIGSVSFGATRIFRLRHYFNKKMVVPVELTHGSFLLMKDCTQHWWEHSLPKITTSIGPRINITFRNIL